jgi:predicted transcriptional regulator
VEVVGVKVAEKKRPAATERRSKRRKTTGDVPALERKSSSFHTQTLTQFLGTAASRLGDEEDGDDDGLRVEDGDDVEDLPLPGNTPVKRSAQLVKAKGKGVAHNPRTPKRIKDPYEIPSSQPSPFTPIAGYSPIPPHRSPLTQKSTNLDAPLPTIETASRIPRTLTIQDSYSTEGFSSSAGGPSPKKEETTPQQPQREPLSELPLGSIELGVGSTPAGETSTARKKRMFVEIPDSEDELESIGSTPFKTRSAQQTPLKREVVPEDFEVAADPGSAARTPRVAVSVTPASAGKSDKENATPPIRVWNEDDNATASEGSPTPRLARQSQAAGRASQVSPNTASQFWTASADDIGSVRLGMGSSGALAELPVLEEPVIEEQEDLGSPLPAPPASQFHGSMGASVGKIRETTPQLEDSEETASEAEEEDQREQEEHIPPSILRKAASQKMPSHGSGEKKRKSTPELITSDSSTSKGPGTPTPVVRKVHIQEPPPPTAEEVYEETPRKPHKSSPLYSRHTQARSQRQTQGKSQRRNLARSQRHTQARSQYYTQGFESQRIPLDVIRRLGPQTDRSDIVISIDPDIVNNIVAGHRDHEFRKYKLPMQVVRCWIYTTRPVEEVKYMATLGPAQQPGQIDSGTGVGNAEFNAGTSGYTFAHKLLQVYELNNPVPLADMPDNGLGDGPPQRYRYLPPAIVGQLLANLRCPLFEESDFEFDEEDDEDGEDVTISQELADQLRDDIIHSTQRPSRKGRHPHFEDDDLIPASQSPIKPRSRPPTTTQKPDHGAFARPPVAALARPSQRLRNQHSQTPFTTTARNTIRPSQATTASNLSSAPPSPAEKYSYPASTGPASVPRPRMPGSSSELSSLPGWAGFDGDGDGDDGEEDSLLRLPPAGELGLGLGGLTSSQAGLLPPDSLLMEEVGMAPPPVEVWDSDDEGY